ncbi:hypothetical protein, partial [Brevibacterium casei]|uniref:hypothetical protein n=1 Tax=Brevibacterium casei TaxID=33889 RepID=UPI001C930CA3
MGITLVLIAGTCVVFAPGGMNPDTRWQLHQVLGNEPLSDWHPAIMTITWMWLTQLTGHASFVLYVQVLIMFGTGFGFAVYLYDVTGSKAWSCLGVLFLLAPHLFTYIGVLWKDTQMAAALVAAVMLLIVVRLLPKAWVLWLPALALLVYAVGLRKNAVFAVVPIAVYLGWCLVSGVRARRTGSTGNQSTADVAGQSEQTEQSERPDKGPRRRGLRTASATVAASLVVLIAIAAGVKATDAIIASRTDVEATGQISQILLDDVMFSVPEDELMRSDAPRELKQHISTARA